MIWIYCWSWMLRTNLCFRDLLWEGACDSDKTDDSENVMITLVITHALNYNSYLSTILIFPATIVISYYIQLLAQVELVADIDHPAWGGGSLKTAEDKNSYIENKMFSICTIMLLVTAHSYLIQKNLAMIVIEKQMIARQQTQLSSFFQNNQDPVLVISKNRKDSKPWLEVELCNSKAKSVLGLEISSSKSVDKYSKTNLQTKMFKLKEKLAAQRSNFAESVFNESENEDNGENQVNLLSIADLVEDEAAQTEVKALAKLILPESEVDEIKVVQITRTELIYNGKQCIVVKLRDISEIREKAKLSAENKMLSLMASSVSHEMITPMRCIVHLAGGLEKKLKDRIEQD